MYRLLIGPIVRHLRPEKASRIALAYYKALGRIPFGRFFNRLIHRNRPEGLEREVFGIQFYNPIGLGAGLDVKGELYNDLNDLGFSFVEIGPVDGSSIRHAISHLQEDPANDVIGACISDDFLTCFSLGYDFFDFFVLDFTVDRNIESIDPVLDARLTYENYKPIIIKLPESLGDAECRYVADYCMCNGVDGIEARNEQQIRAINGFSKGRLPIIANCHINTPEKALEMLSTGASLVEIRSGLVKYGSVFITNTLKYLLEDKNRSENN